MNQRDFEEWTELRAQVEELLEEGRLSWILQDRRDRKAAKRLCDGLSTMVPRNGIWDALAGGDWDITQLDEVDKIARALRDVLIKLKTPPKTAALLTADLIDAIGALKAGGKIDADRLKRAVETATEMICRVASSDNEAKALWTSRRGAQLVAGLAICSAGLLTGEVTLVVLGAGIAGGSAELIKSGIEKFFG